MSSPISIVFVLPDLAAGGAQRVMLAVARGLDPARFDVRLIVLGRGDALRAELPARAEIVRLEAPGVLAALPSLVRLLRRRRPHVVVSVMGYLNLALLALRPLIGRNVKYVVREANAVAASVAALPPWLPARRLYATLYPRATAVVSPTPPIADEIRAVAPRAAPRIIVIPNPVDEDGLRASAARAKPNRGQGIRIVGAGRLTEQKGFDRLIKLMPTLPADARLDIYGEGTRRSELQASIDTLGLSGRVALLGFSGALPENIAAADAFVLPSRWEGLPNVVLEALALGTPVIASDEARIDDIAASAAPGAVTVVPVDWRFADAILRAGTLARTDALRQSLLPAHFRREAVIGQYAELFETVVKFG